MPAPTVTRPRTTLAVEPNSAQANKVDWASYARYGLIAALILGLAGLATAWTFKASEDSREARVRAQWDEVYKGLKDKKYPAERIAALETLAENEKIKGTTAHASVLMELAQEHFDMAQNAKRAPEERAASRDRAIKIYEFIAQTDPFKSNPAFGPLAARDLAVVHEQSQMDLPDTKGLDAAIDSLTNALYQGKGPDAPPVQAMQSHYLFDPMRAQLGRLYWLRAQLKQGAEQKADLDRARDYVNKALEAPPSEEEKNALTQAYYSRRVRESTAAWRSDAAYLKSQLDPPGKLVKDGIPAMREVKKTDDKDKTKPPENPAQPGQTNNKPAEAPKSTQPAKVEPAKPDASKTEPKKEEPKKNEPKKEEPKKEEKKTGSATLPGAPILVSDDTPPPAAHMSYAQIQKLLKEGKSALCLCPRCADGSKAIGAKLAE